jgi:NosR/NirI family transcriptional regulator, nitrous oxide reductase regulator
MDLTSLLSPLFSKKTMSPSYPERPLVNDSLESNIPGLYVAGDLSGTPLVKLTLNQGFDLANHLADRLKSETSGTPDVLDVVVVGAGCAGLGTIRQLKKRGMKVLGLESGRSLMTLRNFTKGKPIFLEPEELEFKDDWGLSEGTRESILDEFSLVIEKEDLPIHEFQQVTSIQASGGRFKIQAGQQAIQSRFLVLSIGKSGNPRKAGVPGEQEYASKIHHRLIDPDDFKDRDILIYGGGDVALEGAMALCHHNRVTLVTIDKEFIFPKKRNVDQLKELKRAGKLELKMDTKLVAVGSDEVGIQSTGCEAVKLKNQVVFEMIGAELPLPFLRKTGLKLESDWSFSKWAGLGLAFVLIYLLYAWKKGYPPFPYQWGIANLPGILSSPSFWYSLLYTVLMTVFGVKAMKRWNKGGKDIYQTWRFLSLIGFQILSFVGIEVILALWTPKYYWRFYGINNPFPLLFDSFYNWSGTDPWLMKWSLVVACLAMTFGVIPLMVRWHGKRFCTWVCGCGGLAETFGDRWRHLSAKGIRAQKWEVVGDIITFWAFGTALVILLVYGGSTIDSGAWHSTYVVLVDFWLIAVIPVALYPFFGGKVWCRLWCPLAKYMQVLSAWYGTLQIQSNEKCISCTECSRFCEVGVDVMSFARNGASFDNRNSSCIHCGICISVCPMNVLSFQRRATGSKGREK